MDEEIPLEETTTDEDEIILDEVPVTEKELEDEFVSEETASEELDIEDDEIVLDDIEEELELDDKILSGSDIEDEEDEVIEDVPPLDFEPMSEEELSLESDPTSPFDDINENIDIDGLSDVVFEEVDMDESDSPDMELEEEPPAIPDMDDTEAPDDMGSSVEDIPDTIKEEIRSVLSYMDKLLEALPDDKIEEFAKSEHFNVYQKLFDDLGLTEE
ncbi:MAG: hypothetical protein JEY99_13495 [Spirochaetales bacterium]|nr:hypothetical protein [Spirochaetales bacterium]